jgi:hypothetical protein
MVKKLKDSIEIKKTRKNKKSKINIFTFRVKLWDGRILEIVSGFPVMIDIVDGLVTKDDIKSEKGEFLEFKERKGRN